jgi:hypothetical protein
MPTSRRSRSTQSEQEAPLTLVFAGSGHLEPEAIMALLDDIVTGREVERVVIPVSTDDWTAEIETVATWAMEKNLGFTSVSSDEAQNDETLSKVTGAAVDDWSDAGNMVASLVEVITGNGTDDPAANGRLYFFWNPDMDFDRDLFDLAQQEGVKSYDLLDGGSPLESAPVDAPVTEKAPTAGGRGKGVADPVGGGSVDPLSFEELIKLTHIELKQRAVELKVATQSELRGRDPSFIADLIVTELRERKDAGGQDPQVYERMSVADLKAEIEVRRGAGREITVGKGRGKAPYVEALTGDDEATHGDGAPVPGQDGEPDEAQATMPSAARQRAVEPSEEPDGGEDTTDVAKDRLLASSTTEEMTLGTGIALEQVTKALVDSLMLFTKYAIEEARKGAPTPAGEPDQGPGAPGGSSRRGRGRS